MIHMTLKPNVSAVKITAFQKKILTFYKNSGRDLPWRRTHDPYHILVSEFMLQQTQAVRVIPKYEKFIKKFRTVEILARSNTKDILTLWQGLGYNRRALYLKRAAEIIVNEYKGIVPRNAEELEQLPGIGPYTARAIVVFAYDAREIVIETNIRSIFIHEFFKDKERIRDEEIVTLIEKTLPSNDFRKWYAALMDYGSLLKQTIGNPSRKSKTYIRQKPFSGSNRQVRGQILRLLLENPISSKDLALRIGKDKLILADTLVQEGFANKKNGRYSLVV